MKSLKLILMVTLISALFGSVSADAQIAQPGLIYYKGSLVDIQGKLIQDTLSITFSIFNVPLGGTPLWTETHPAVIIWGGVYSILLGSLEPIPEAVFWDQVPGSVVRLGGDRWLGVNVEDHDELIPRKRVATVAYAYIADVVDGRHAAEFVSSVHPDTMEGVDWCSHTIPMLTVLNGCDGGGIRGECATGAGVTGVGDNGVYGSTAVAGGLPVHGWAQDPATQAGYFAGNVTVNGNTHIGLDMADFHHLRSAGKDAWGYLYSPGAGVPTQPSGMDLAYNFHEDTTGTMIVDNSGPGFGTSLIRLSDGRIELSTNANPAEPIKRVQIDTSGVIFYGAVATPRFKVDTLYVPDTCHVANALHVQNGSMSVGAPAPSNMKLHVKGTGTYGSESKGQNHIARFENTGSSSSDGIAIKLCRSGNPNHDDRFVTFYGNSNLRGRIEGQSNWGDMATHDQSYLIDKLFFIFHVGALAIDVAGVAGSFNVCPGFGIAICPPIPSDIARVAAIGVAVAAKQIAYEAFRATRIGVSYQSGTADYAEWLKRIDEGEMMQPGDIVGVFGGRISKETQAAQQLLVVSAAPIVLGNMSQEGEEHLYEKVAFLGRIPVKVIGPVREGDYILPSGLSDGSGIAVSPELMTADDFSKVVGRAWNGSSDSHMKYIDVVVGMHTGDLTQILEKQKTVYQQMRNRMGTVKTKLDEMDDLNRRLAEMEMILHEASSSPASEPKDQSDGSRHGPE